MLADSFSAVVISLQGAQQSVPVPKSYRETWPALFVWLHRWSLHNWSPSVLWDNLCSLLPDYERVKFVSGHATRVRFQNSAWSIRSWFKRVHWAFYTDVEQILIQIPGLTEVLSWAHTGFLLKTKACLNCAWFLLIYWLDLGFQL